MKLKKSKYKKILKLKKKFRFTDFELITNYGLFSGDTNLFKTLTIFDLVKQTASVKGDIIELGIHKGNTSLLFENISVNFENLKRKKFYLQENIKKLIYLSNKDYARDLLLFSICINNKIKTLNIEKLIDYVANCEIPIFPISGDYLKKYGYVTGQALGKKLKSLEAKWIENDFIIEKKTIEKSLDKISKD